MNLPDPGIGLGSPALQANSLPTELSGKLPTLKKEERSWLNSLTLYLKELEKWEWTKSKISRKKEMVRIGAEINETETRSVIENNNKKTNWC